MNTHAPAPYAGEGIYEWLKNREPRWAKLAIIHRLDKETSGLLIFSKTTEANRSLTEQFATRRVRKTYRFITDRKATRKEFVVQSTIAREGERYVSKPDGEDAETRFRLLQPTVFEAEPITGRTHQIRVHAAESGLPIVGDTLYGGTPADRLLLHAERLKIKHPISGKEMLFDAPADFSVGRSRGLREALIPLDETNAYRLLHGASDGWPGWYVDRLGDFLLSQSERALSAEQIEALKRHECKGAYHKALSRHAREESPAHLFGDRKSTRLNSSHGYISYAVFCLKKKKKKKKT